MWCLKAWNAPINQGNIDVAALEAQVLTFNNRLAQLFKTVSDVKASRAINVTYTNTLDRPILVNVMLLTTVANEVATLVVAGVPMYGSAYPVTNSSIAVSAIVPAGATYKVPTGNYTVVYWSEIR